MMNGTPSHKNRTRTGQRPEAKHQLVQSSREGTAAIDSSADSGRSIAVSSASCDDFILAGPEA